MRLLTTDEVARHLGVRRATVYAYVSRGLLTSRRNGQGKESLFDEADVRVFAAQRQRGGAAPPETVVHTGITLVTGDALYYRGLDATTLARRESFESVATLLWTGTLGPGVVEPDPVRRALTGAGTAPLPAAVEPDPARRAAAGAGTAPLPAVFEPDPALRALAEAVTAPLPAGARLTDRLRVVVAALGAADPLRFDTTPAAVIATGQTLLATMIAALPVRTAYPVESGGLAAQLWNRLSTSASTPERIAVLNAALVLLADHDLAASTYAARVAASTRAHPYAVVSAGLAALAGPLHGGASSLVADLLATAIRTGDAMGTVSDRLRTGSGVPGFGHRIYTGGDPRAATLLDLIAALTPLGVIDDVRAAMRTPPNVDFALATLTLLSDMPPDAGEAIFAIARTAGWLAHALEEYGDQPSRFRPSGRYEGRPPAAG